MARILLVCARDGDLSGHQSVIAQATSLMTPDTIVARPPVRNAAPGIVGLLINPPANALVARSGLGAGHLFKQESGWEEVGTLSPDGSFVLSRWDDDHVEILSDAAGSRTLWYAHTDTLFVASNSIRAIVHILGDFAFNPEAASWVLATGALGPDVGWDKRVRRLPPDSIGRLDRTAWQVAVETKEVVFAEQPGVDPSAMLGTALDEALSSLELPSNGVLLTISGGYDSRFLLLRLRDRTDIQYATWGTAEALQRAYTDAAVAVRLASTLRVKHEYLTLRDERLAISEILHRFIDQAEGTIDHVTGYADGLAIWADLYARGITIYVRGDEGFGWSIARTPTQTRRDLGLSLLSDYFTAEEMMRLGLTDIYLPDRFGRDAGETLESWRDRLYHSYRIPVVLAALNEIKAGFLDALNPLLARNVLQTIRILPDHARTDKVTFKAIVEGDSPDVPYAREGSNITIDKLLRSQSFLQTVRDELDSAPQQLFSQAFKDHVLHQLEKALANRSSRGLDLRRMLRRLVPPSIKARFRATKYSSVRAMEPELLAFRAYTIARMHRILSTTTVRSL
jgi:hypothetical protein